MRTLVLQCDATPGARQGQAGVGVILRDLRGRIVHWHMAVVPAQTCNGAEYQALIAGLRLAQQHYGPCALICLTDSQIVVEQMAGRSQVRAAGLHPLHTQACALVPAFRTVQVVHIPRATNRLADALAWEALGGTATLLRVVAAHRTEALTWFSQQWRYDMGIVAEQVDALVADGQAMLLSGSTAEPIGKALTLNGLATPPQVVPRRFLGIVVPVLVPPGMTAVLSGPQGIQRVLPPGSYHLWDIPRGPVMVQWVATNRQRRTIGPLEGWSADKWRVRLALVVEFQVADPVLIATHRAPLAALDDAVRSSVLHQLERYSHAALTGYDHEVGGIDGPAQAIQQRLAHDPALGGLAIVHIHLLERTGDERRIEAATETAVAIAQLEEQTRLRRAEDQAALSELDGQSLRQHVEAELRLAARLAEGREQLALHDITMQRHTLDAHRQVMEAQITAQVAQIAHDEQEWQAEQARLHAEWQATLQRQQGEHHTDQVVRVLAMQREFDTIHAERAQLADERRAKHERELLSLQMRHEQVLLQQRERLDSWRTQHDRALLLTQQQHTEQLAIINGTTAIATEAAGRIAQLGSVMTRRRPEVGGDDVEGTAVAGEGLRTLRMLQEQRSQPGGHGTGAAGSDAGAPTAA